MSGKITAEVLEARLKCKYKAHLRMAGERGEPHDHELLLRESRAHVRVSAEAKLAARHPGQEIPSGRPLTADVLKRGSPLLLGTTLEDEDVCLRFDALLRVQGDSGL